MRMLAGSDSMLRSSRVMLSRSDSVLILSASRVKSWLARSFKCSGDARPVEEVLERLRERKEEKTPSWLLVLEFARGRNISWLAMESKEGLRGGRPLILEDRTGLNVSSITKLIEESSKLPFCYF